MKKNDTTVGVIFLKGTMVQSASGGHFTCAFLLEANFVTFYCWISLVG